jgi:hypothetical protein
MALLDLQGMELAAGAGPMNNSSSSTGCGVESSASLALCTNSSLSLTACH